MALPKTIVMMQDRRNQRPVWNSYKTYAVRDIFIYMYLYTVFKF